MGHVDPFGADLDHPRVLQHSPRGATTSWLLLETVEETCQLLNSSLSHSQVIVAHAIWLLKKSKRYDLPTLNEVLEISTPFDARLGLVLESRYRLSHNICEKIDHARSWLHLGAVCGKGESMLRNF